MNTQNKFGNMVHLSVDGEYKQVYQKVEEYLSQHFTRLPEVEMYYDAKGTLQSENRRHQIVTGGLVIVEIHRERGEDAIGLLIENDQVEMDAVSTRSSPDLKNLYGYHE